MEKISVSLPRYTRVAAALNTVLVGAILISVPNAFAEEPSVEKTAPTERKKSSPSEEQDVMMVTGEKINRTIYDTGSSVAVYNMKRIEEIPNPDVNTLLQMTPNVVDNGNSNALPAVRGVDGSGPAQGASAFLSGTRPRINYSIDGRSFTYNELGYGAQSLWDVESVEIFRDPQSYIQGRNAIAGAVIVKTLDPTFDWESAVKGGWGEQSFQQKSAMISGPIFDDSLAFRLSVDRQDRDSFANLTSYQPVGDPRRVESTTVRAKLLFEPLAVPELISKLTYNHLDSRAPQNEARLAASLPVNAPSRFRPILERKTSSGIWDISWEASDNLTFENKLIYTDFTNHRRTAKPNPAADIEGKEIEVEPLMRFKNEMGDLSGLVGIRYFHGKQDEFVDLFNGSYFKDKTETASAYGVLTYGIVPEVDMTFSGRFEREHRTRNGGSNTLSLDFDETYNTFLPKVDVAWKPINNQTVGFAVGRGYNAGGAGVTLGSPIVTYTYDPEYVWNYSLYTRNSLLDNKLEVMTNLFYNDYKDMQLPYYLGENSSTIRNASKVETYGTELSARYVPINDLELNASLGLLKTKIKSFDGSGSEGNELPRAPAYSANLGAKYQITDYIDISGNVQLSDSYYSQYDNNIKGKVDSFWFANMQLGYDFKWGRATVFAQNIFDSDKRILVPDNNTDSAIYQRPRMIGTTLELKF